MGVSDVYNYINSSNINACEEHLACKTTMLAMSLKLFPAHCGKGGGHMSPSPPRSASANKTMVKYLYIR